MKKLFLIIAIAVSSTAVIAQGVNFREITFKEACTQAKAENKLIFVDCYTSWCGPCKLMASEIFPMKEMGNYFNPKFVSVKYDAERNEEGVALKDKYGIKAYPTFLVCDSDGNLIHMFAGGVLSLEFIHKVEESFNPDLAFGSLQKRYNAGERSKKLVASYIKALTGTYTEDTTPMADDFLKSLSDDEVICEECLFLFDDFARLGSPREKFVSDNLEKFRSVVGRAKVDQLMKKKYSAYYSNVLGKQMVANPEDIEKVNKQLELQQLTDADILPVYQAAINTYLKKEGSDVVFSKIGKIAGKVSNDEMDVFLYFTIPALYEQWNKGQRDHLMALITRDGVRDKVVKSLERLEKAKSTQG